jgi:hypothetical protein
MSENIVRKYIYIYIYIFCDWTIYLLFNDAVISSDYTASNDGMINDFGKDFEKVVA